MTTTNGIKKCNACQLPKLFSEFYLRTGQEGNMPGHYTSECKTCMRERGKIHLPPTVPRSPTEIVAIDYLTKRGIPCLPGKAVKAADVDIVAWGCVWIEVKYSSYRRNEREFIFRLTPTQQKRGLLAHVVMLICDYGDRQTLHLFRPDHAAFYHQDRLKAGFSYIPGRTVSEVSGGAVKGTYQTLTDDMMAEAQDRLELIETARLEIAAKLITS